MQLSCLNDKLHMAYDKPHMPYAICHMVVGKRGVTSEVGGGYLNDTPDTYSGTTNVKYTLSCTQLSKIVANGVEVPHLGAGGRRTWPKT